MFVEAVSFGLLQRNQTCRLTVKRGKTAAAAPATSLVCRGLLLEHASTRPFPSLSSLSQDIEGWQKKKENISQH